MTRVVLKFTVLQDLDWKPEIVIISAVLEDKSLKKGQISRLSCVILILINIILPILGSVFLCYSCSFDHLGFLQLCNLKNRMFNTCIGF